jgi:hypothetical protein
MNRRNSQAVFTFLALTIALAVLIATVLAITPHLHQWLHGASQHECVVTLIAAGKYDHPTTTSASVVPDCLQHEAVSFPQQSHVAAPALEFSLLEHAPPAVS